MLKSMTGFAKVEVEGPEGKLYGEAKSLNSRISRSVSKYRGRTTLTSKN